MSDFATKHRKILKVIHHKYCDFKSKYYFDAEKRIFEIGHSFLEFGTIKLSDVALLLKAQLIFIRVREVDVNGGVKTYQMAV